ncbi:MAG: hypothetical protein ABR557_14815, partial [Pyrinomonadaceae bacterium]
MECAGPAALWSAVTKRPFVLGLVRASSSKGPKRRWAGALQRVELLAAEKTIGGLEKRRGLLDEVK